MIQRDLYILALVKAAEEKGDHSFRNAMLGGAAGGAGGALAGSLYAGRAARKAVEGGMGKLVAEAQGVSSLVKGKVKNFERMSIFQKLRYIMGKKAQARKNHSPKEKA